MFGTAFWCCLHSVYLQYYCYEDLQKNPDKSYEYFDKWFEIICYTRCCNERFIGLYAYHLINLKSIYDKKRFFHNIESDMIVVLEFLVEIAFNCIPLNCFDEIQEYSYWTFSKNDFYMKNTKKTKKGELSFLH